MEQLVKKIFFRERPSLCHRFVFPNISRLLDLFSRIQFFKGFTKVCIRRSQNYCIHFDCYTTHQTIWCWHSDLIRRILLTSIITLTGICEEFCLVYPAFLYLLADHFNPGRPNLGIIGISTPNIAAMITTTMINAAIETTTTTKTLKRFTLRL